MRKPWDFEEPLCAEVGVELFFARDSDDKEQLLRATSYQEAKSLCNKCVHQMECAEWGIKNEEHGVWGGLSPTERTAIRRVNRIPITPRQNIIR
jgi:WhiB family redox-sensing transcriptional regulator